MWHVTSQRGDEPSTDSLLAQVSGRPVDRLALEELFSAATARGGVIPASLVGVLELGEGWRTSSVYSIDVWGPTAAETGPELLVVTDGALRWRGTRERNCPDETVVWHDYTTMLARASAGSELEVRYVPEPEDEERDGKLLRWRTRPRRWPYERDERILDWRFYLGTDTTVIEGQTRFERWKGRLRARLRIPSQAGRATGTVVGKVMQIEGPTGGSLATDEFWEGHLAGEEANHKALARRYPRIDAGLSADADRELVTVMVHGTRSTTLPALEMLADKDCLTEPTYRFEHDTFVGLAANAMELAREIDVAFPITPSGEPRVRLIAHSRGGLVARWARAQLQRTGRHKVEVITLGTPHRGTPIVGHALSRLAGPLGIATRPAGVLSMDTLTDSRGIPMTNPMMLAGAYLFRGSELPEGIRSMAPDSDALAALEYMPGADAYEAFGGDCDLKTTPPGFTPGFAAGLAGQLFPGEPNDLVVALASSRPGSNGTTVRCAHSAYFHEQEVQTRIRRR
jgi:hypothetical protein